MSQENVEIVRRGLEAFNRADWEGATAQFAQDVEWQPSSGWPDTTPHRGRESIRAFWAELSSTLEGFTADLDELFDAGDDVVAFVRTRGRGRGSGMEVSREIGQVYTLSEGKVVRIVGYDRRSEALAAAGLL